MKQLRGGTVSGRDDSGERGGPAPRRWGGELVSVSP